MGGVKFYCESCGDMREVIIEPLSTDELNKPSIWGDILCKVCTLVIATVTADEPGKYEFVKVRED